MGPAKAPGSGGASPATHGNFVGASSVGRTGGATTPGPADEGKQAPSTGAASCDCGAGGGPARAHQPGAPVVAAAVFNRSRVRSALLPWGLWRGASGDGGAGGGSSLLGSSSVCSNGASSTGHTSRDGGAGDYQGDGACGASGYGSTSGKGPRALCDGGPALTKSAGEHGSGGSWRITTAVASVAGGLRGRGGGTADVLMLPPPAWRGPGL